MASWKINRGAIAKARVLERKGAGRWGRARTINLKMDVTGVDGTRVPIELLGQMKGINRSRAVLAAAIVTVVFPHSPPAGLILLIRQNRLYDLSRALGIASLGNTIVVCCRINDTSINFLDLTSPHLKLLLTLNDATRGYSSLRRRLSGHASRRKNCFPIMASAPNCVHAR